MARSTNWTTQASNALGANYTFEFQEYIHNENDNTLAKRIRILVSGDQIGDDGKTVRVGKWFRVQGAAQAGDLGVDPGSSPADPMTLAATAGQRTAIAEVLGLFAKNWRSLVNDDIE